MPVGCAWFVISGAVFRLFGEAQLPTYVMALGVGVMVPVLAHLTGVYRKRGEHRFFVLAMYVGLVDFLVTMVVLRSLYSDASGAGSASTGVGEPTRVVSWPVMCAAAGLTVLFVIASSRMAAPITSGGVQ